MTAALFVLLLSGCQFVMDFDSLRAGKTDGSTQLPDLQQQLPDTGSCQSGAACTVVDALGLCRIGQALCFETGPDGLCQQQIFPGDLKEECDGKDQDCDGIADGDDPDAHASCGAGKYCGGSSCLEGCWSNASCANNNSCVERTCRCGERSACTGQFRCIPETSRCVCGSNGLSCGAGETCDSVGGGRCVCGDTTNITGPVCSGGSCVGGICQTSGLDAGPDRAVPDLVLSDLPPSDLPLKPDQGVDLLAPDQAAAPDLMEGK